jgi:5-methylcytosine-specific restriction enzyme A
MRREFSAKTKDAAWERCKGLCEECARQLTTGDVFYDYDHITADALGGEPTLENCQVLCRTCHGIKTRTRDVPLVAKGRSVRRKDRGIRKPSRFRKVVREKTTTRENGLRAMREEHYRRTARR